MPRGPLSVSVTKMFPGAHGWKGAQPTPRVILAHNVATRNLVPPPPTDTLSYKDHSFVEMEISSVPADETKDVYFSLDLIGDHPSPTDLFIHVNYDHDTPLYDSWLCNAFVASHDGSSVVLIYSSESTAIDEAPALANGDILRIQTHDDTVQVLLNGSVVLDFAAGTDVTSWSNDFGWKVTFIQSVQNLTVSGTNASPALNLTPGEVAISAIRAGTLEYLGIPETVRWEETFSVDGPDPGPDWVYAVAEGFTRSGSTPAWQWEMVSEMYVTSGELVLDWYENVMIGSPPATPISPPLTGWGAGASARTVTEVITPGP